MFESALGRLVNGALWGLGAGLVITITRDGGEGARSLTKGLIKGYIGLTDRVQEATADMREGFEDLAAEARAENARTPTSTAQ